MTGYDDTLYLAGSFVYLGYTRVTEVTLHREILQVTGAAATNINWTAKIEMINAPW